MNKHQRALKAAAAARRIPIVGTTVVVLPFFRAAQGAGLSSTNLNMNSISSFGQELVSNFTGVESAGHFNSGRFLSTWGPIAAYLLTRRFAKGTISKVLRPLGLRY